MSAKFILAAVAASLAATAVPTTAAFAGDRDDRYYSRDDDRRYEDRRYDDRRYDDRRWNNRRYDDRGWINVRGDDRRWNDRNYGRRDDRRWNNSNQGRNQGYNQGRCYDEGKGGTVIGAIAGGLLGNTVAGRGDRLLGTVIGGGIGAVAGRAIDKSDGRDCFRR